MSSEAVDQLVLKSCDGTTVRVLLFPTMTNPAHLACKLPGADVSKYTPTVLNASDSNWEQYVALLRALWPAAMFGEVSELPAGVHTCESIVHIKVGKEYFRAIAKIALHYFLNHSHRFDGYEDELEGIRAFVRYGDGAIEDYFLPNSDRLFRSDLLGPNASPDRWCHLLAAAEREGRLIAYVCLFKGRGYHGIERHVHLGHFDPTFSVALPVVAHAYGYYQDWEKGNVEGRREAIRIDAVNESQVQGVWGFVSSFLSGDDEPTKSA